MLLPVLQHPTLRRILRWSALLGWLGCGGDGGTGIELPSLHVTTATSGVELDPDGYTVVVDGGTGRPIGPTASIDVGSLEDGAHTVELSGVAANCAVGGTHPRTVQVTRGNTTEVAFEIECRATTGSIRVGTSTSGPDQDEDGYVVVVEGDAREIGTNDTLIVDLVPTGDRVVELLGVAANCVALTATFSRVTVSGGDTVDVAFGLGCAARQPNTGALHVTTTTTGPSPDPDGYTVTVDAGIPAPVPATGSILVPGLAVGPHAVALSGIAANCAVGGSNPADVTVTGTEVAVLAFAVTCTDPPASSGTLRLATVTTGSDPDPNGYTIAVDDGPAQPLGANVVISIANLAAGAHTLLLADVAPNCTVADNPRTVNVPADDVVEAGFAASCVPATGTIATTAVTTGASLDPDGYVVRVNGGSGQELPINGTVTLSGLIPGTHRVQLDNVATNCQVSGSNPRNAVVAGNETTSVSFSVACASITGSLTVTVEGLPPEVPAAVTVTGPDEYTASLTASATLTELLPGSYTVTAGDVAVGQDTYRPGVTEETVTVAAGGAPELTVSYARSSEGSINLRILGLYITQGSQTPDGSVPLVAGRDGYLRVFVVANGENSVAPAVRVRLYQNGSVVETLGIDAPSGSTPTLVEEAPLPTSWNVRVPGGLIQPGLGVLAEVDPAGEIEETDEGDNTFPSDAAPRDIAVQRASTFALRLVPVQVGQGGLTGGVSPANRDRYLDEAQAMFPLPGIDADVHAGFTSSVGPLQPNDGNGAWITTLLELNVVRLVEGSGRTYYGVVRTGYGSGIVGLGFVGTPTAIGWDNPAQAGRTTAHELGHNWGRRHAPCGNPGGPDPDYPHVGGVIGVYGLDLRSETLIDPSRPDIMGYCSPPWISDYTYLAVLAFRDQFQPPPAAARAAAGRVQPTLIVWGRIERGRVVLEPAFAVDTRPSLPGRPGRYRLEGTDVGGSRVFDLSFDPVAVVDGPEPSEHFAFAVPLSAAAVSELSSLRVTGPAGAAAISVAPAARAGAAPPPMQVRRAGARVAVQWDAAAGPMAMVRDAATGEVLAMGRGGRVDLSSQADRLEIHVSDGVRSRPVRVTVAR